MRRGRNPTTEAHDRARPPGKHAVSFVFVVVLIDMMGFGLIMPVLPRLIEDVGSMSLQRLR